MEYLGEQEMAELVYQHQQRKTGKHLQNLDENFH